MTRPTNIGRAPAAIIDRAVRLRESGRWPSWTWHALPGGVPGAHGWAREVRRVAENGIFTVLVREVPTPWGAVLHAMISIACQPEPSWYEKQRIKDTVFGRPRTAIEVFPPHDDIVDGADSYHLWVLPEGMKLPFGLT